MRDRLATQADATIEADGETDATRARLVRFLMAHPGPSTRRVAAELGVDESTADYHLRRLLRRGKVVPQRVGRELVWYVNGSGFCPVLRAALPHLRRESVRRVAQALERAPRTAGEVALAAGVRVGEVRWASQALEGAGLAARSPNGRIMLREGASICVEKGCAQSPCALWGRCIVSQEEARMRRQAS